MVNTNTLVPMTDVNQNFSKVVRVVDESGIAVIMKNNKTRYIVGGFENVGKYPSAEETAARLCYSLTNDRAFGAVC